MSKLEEMRTILLGECGEHAGAQVAFAHVEALHDMVRRLLADAAHSTKLIVEAEELLEGAEPDGFEEQPRQCANCLSRICNCALAPEPALPRCVKCGHIEGIHGARGCVAYLYRSYTSCACEKFIAPA